MDNDVARQELIDRLTELARGNDPESNHSQADGLLLAYIGDQEIEDAYDAIKKWYA